MWIKQSRSHVGFFQGDHRTLLQILGAIKKSEIVYYHTFNIRHNINIARLELIKFLQFLVCTITNEELLYGLIQ